MLSSIYKILNKANGKFYIGSAVNFKKRWWVHLCRLRQNKHDNKHLQAAWNEHGELSFEFIILERCAKDALIVHEQIWLDWTKSFNREIGYNTCIVAGNTVGYKHTKEFKIWQSDRVRGSKHSEETKAKMSASQKGKIVSKETAAKIAKAKTGKSRVPIKFDVNPLVRKDNGSWH